ncbi:hypothetical protein LRS06_19145 [Hymenobacter sp. J193]|uniref:hypothetical protein n=1 Tax=Hymenobacter sp. J193 TaxID=2898429 RepID=UPI0021511CB5|nr:hypothetical protein [Hymenobacter sp. J193]MCR5889848.1 hypothetical protein [Hymenobacter sp. J193]
MKIPENSAELKDAIVISATLYPTLSKLRERQLLFVLRAVPDEIVVEGIIQVFELGSDTEVSFIQQEIAGNILSARKPATIQSVSSVVKRCLNNWNKSIEQLPLWLVSAFGSSEIKAAFGALEKSNLTQVERENLVTMKWWLAAKI